MNNGVEISKRLVLINSMSSVAAQGLNIAVRFWVVQYLLNRITTDEYSLFPVVSAVIAFTPMLTAILTGGVGRYAVAAYARKDEREVTQIVSTIFPPVLGTGLALLAIGWTFAWYVDRILTIPEGRVADAQIMLALLVFSVAMRLIALPFTIGLYIRQRFVLSNMILVGTDLFRIALLFILLVGVGPRVVWVVLATVTANMCGLCVTLAVSKKLVPALRFRPSEFRRDRLNDLISFGAWSFVGQIAMLIHDSADPIILNKLSTPFQVTALHLGAMVDQQIRGLTSQASAPLLPPLTAMSASGDIQRVQNTFLRGSRYELWAVLIMAAPLVIFRKELVTVYVGEAFETAAIVLLLVLGSYPLNYATGFLAKVAHAKAEMRAYTARSLAANIANLALTIYFVGALDMGAVGAALGTFLTRAVLAPVLFWPLMRKMVGVSYGRWLRETVVPGVLPVLAGAAAWLPLGYFASPDSWFELGLCAAAGCAVYGAFLSVFCLNPDEKNDLKRLARNSMMRLSTWNGGN